jgi:hypothetical protein
MPFMSVVAIVHVVDRVAYRSGTAKTETFWQIGKPEHAEHNAQQDGAHRHRDAANGRIRRGIISHRQQPDGRETTWP